MSGEGVLPEVGTVVRIDVSEGEALLPVACVVVGIADDELAVEAPAVVGDAVLAPPGTALTVRWAARRGLYDAPAVLAAAAAAGWTLRLTGAAELVQRRRYARASMQTVVAVVPVVDGLRRVVGGWLLDLGEGGARAHLELSETLDPGSPVEVHLTLEDVPVAVTGTVLRVADTRGLRAVGAATQRMAEVVVVFDERVDDLARIRRSVLREQVRARRARVVTP